MPGHQTGEAMSGATTTGAENATALQRQILDQVHTVNRRDANSENERALARPYRSKELDSGMLELLRRIERNTGKASAYKHTVRGEEPTGSSLFAFQG